MAEEGGGLLLFQEGITDVFFPALEARGATIVRFPTDPAAAHKIFRFYSTAETIFFRANFPLGDEQLSLLPKLKLAVLVSTGLDSVDAAAVAKKGIRLVSAEGANAGAVFDYVIQALLLGGYDPGIHSVGIVGAGRIGGRVLRFLAALCARVEYYDPFLAEAGSLDAVLRCDFVSFHVPLKRQGEHKTAGMLDEAYFAPVRKKLRLIQTCRGAIWNATFYRNLKNHPYLELLAQDVYPEEPPSATDIARAVYSTPHIAGYSTRGRLGGVVKGIQFLFPDFNGESYYPQGSVWSLADEARRFAANPEDFSKLRDNYAWRKEFFEFNEAERIRFREICGVAHGKLLEALFSGKWQ